MVIYFHAIGNHFVFDPKLCIAECKNVNIIAFNSHHVIYIPQLRKKYSSSIYNLKIFNGFKRGIIQSSFLIRLHLFSSFS